MIENTYKCDGCGVAKQQTNHWFLMEVGKETFTVLTWDSSTANDPLITHYCGAGCLSKAVSLWASPKPLASMVYPEPARQLDCGCWNVCQGYKPTPLANIPTTAIKFRNV